jgi:hypothetical protein
MFAHAKFSQYLLLFLFLMFPAFTSEVHGNGNEPVEQFIRTHQGIVDSAQKVQCMSNADLGINSKQRISFLKQFSGVVSEYQKILPDYKTYKSAATFCAIRCIDNKELAIADSAENSSGNSLYCAFALLTGTGIDPEAIDNRDHLNTLASSYGISLEQVENGIWEVLTRDWNSITAGILVMIEKNTAHYGKNDRERYLKNVLHPFMTLLCRGYSMPDRISRSVVVSFSNSFNDSNHVFEKFLPAFKNYLNGDTFNSSYTSSLNKLLKPYGYRMSIDLNKCITYKLLDYNIKGGTGSIGDVILQKRLGIELLSNDLGMAICTDNDITLTYDNILEIANDLSIIVKSDSLPLYYYDNADTIWKAMQCPMSVRRANELYRVCVRNDFANRSGNKVIQQLIRQTTVHELKHKWDETIDTSRTWTNLDLEISAHLAEIQFSGCPHYAMMDYINRMQTFYLHNNYSSVHKKLKPLIVDGWRLVERIQGSAASDKQLIEYARKVYSRYTTLDKKKLPPYAGFEKKIVQGMLKTVPELIIR